MTNPGARSRAPDYKREKEREAIRQALAKDGKCGDEWRMRMSLLDVNERVFTHKNAGPLKLGLPIGTWRLDDEGADKTDAPEKRMHYRRIVMLTFQPKTGNKQWALLNLNVFGEEARASAVPTAPQVSPHKALFEAINIDFFEEFQMFNYALQCGGKILWVKKSRVFTMMSRWWKLG